MSKIEVLINTGVVQDAERKIASAFLRQRYPLSEEGLDLSLRVKEALLKGELPKSLIEELPTVEHLHSRLFRSVLLTDKQSSRVLSRNLKTVQITEGCSHQCEHCFLAAGKRLHITPFAAIVQVAKEMRKIEGQFYKKMLQNWEDKSQPKEVAVTIVNNYSDGDPLDYVDRCFLHEDGSPADYGDVFKLLASRLHPIHVSTAGWRPNNLIAARAIEKIKALLAEDPEILAGCRLSANFKERLAKQNYEAYIKNVLRMIKVMEGILTDIDLTYDKLDLKEWELAQLFYMALVWESEKLSPAPQCRLLPMSRFSGRNGIEDAGDFDPFGSMKDNGYYILQSGEIMKRHQSKSGQKGIRPEPTGMWAFKLSEKEDNRVAG